MVGILFSMQLTGSASKTEKGIRVVNPVLQYPHRKCPVCDHLGAELLHEQRFQGVAGTGLLDGYDVVACKSCGAVFSDHLPPVERFAEYYSSASKYEFSHRGGEQHREEIIRVEGLAKWLASQLPLGAPILDVGCATGELLLKLRQEGFSDITGLDPSRECVERARNLHGLTMIEGVLGSRKPDQRSYGAVILSAVLEHIPATDLFVKDLIQWTNSSGYLVVEVPDLEFFDQSWNAPFQEMSVEHVNFFTGPSLKNLMRRHGFKAVAERHFMCPAAPGVLTGAVLTVLFQKSNHAGRVEHEDISKSSMTRYLEQCRRIVDSESSAIRKIVESKQPVIVWGTGTLCQRLLAQGELGKATITCFVDSNLHYQGKNLAGIPIISPREINSDHAILITSWSFQDEITETIRKTLGLNNPIITLR